MLFRLLSFRSLLFFSVSILLISFPYRFISTLLISTSLQRISIPFQLQSFRSGQFLFFTCHYCSKSRHIQSIPFLVISRLIFSFSPQRFSLSPQRFPLHSFSFHSLALLFLLRAHLLLSTPSRSSSVLRILFHTIPFQSRSITFHAIPSQIFSVLFLLASFQVFSLSVNLQGFRI